MLLLLVDSDDRVLVLSEDQLLELTSELVLDTLLVLDELSSSSCRAMM